MKHLRLLAYCLAGRVDALIYTFWFVGEFYFLPPFRSQPFDAVPRETDKCHFGNEIELHGFPVGLMYCWISII